MTTSRFAAQRKTLTLIADAAALPALLETLLCDVDPVVQGSAVGAMAAVGERALDPLLSVLVNPEASAMQQGLASWGIAFIGARAPVPCAKQPVHPMPRSGRLRLPPSANKFRHWEMITLGSSC